MPLTPANINAPTINPPAVPVTAQPLILNVPAINPPAAPVAAQPNSVATEDKRTVDEKLRDFIDTHYGSSIWKSSELAKAIGATSESVRKTKTWIDYRKKQKKIQEENAEILRSNDQISAENVRKTQRRDWGDE